MLYTVDDNRKFPFSTVGILSISVAVYEGKKCQTIVKLGNKERFDKKQIGVKETFLRPICQSTS